MPIEKRRKYNEKPTKHYIEN